MPVTIDSQSNPYTILEKAHKNFATAAIEEAFDWERFAQNTDLSGWYLVAFRSTRKTDANLTELEMLDELAHQDAATQPGFLFYYKGKILEGATHLHNLSFCMWTDRDSAKAAAGRAMHRQASAVALKMYERYTLERYDAAVTRKGQMVRVEFSPV